MTLSAPWSIKRVFGEGAMRIMASICLGVLLASCNMVTSQTPLFSSADTQGQAQFRSGIWMDEEYFGSPRKPEAGPTMGPPAVKPQPKP